MPGPCPSPTPTCPIRSTTRARCKPIPAPTARERTSPRGRTTRPRPGRTNWPTAALRAVAATSPARIRCDGSVRSGYRWGVRTACDRGGEMATGETGFEDVFYDLVSVQYHSLKAGHDYGQYVRDADNAGEKDTGAFFRGVRDQGSKRAARCHEFLKRLTGTEQGGPAAQ